VLENVPEVTRMKTKPFLLFVGPSLVVMLVFIAGPLLTVFVQSFRQTQNALEVVEQEKCDPFGCKTTTVTIPKLDENGRAIRETRWVGFENYQTIFDWPRVSAAFSESGRVYRALMNIPFWSALRFTLMFTLVTLPLVLGIGLVLAFSVNAILQSVRGPIIFVTLLPMIVTPVIGALAIRWLFIGDGIVTAQLEKLTGQNIAMFAQGWTIELLLYFYRVWHAVPFAFIIFYAALQTLQSEQLEAARIDGATRWQTIRNVIIPHLMPLLVFVGLIHLMDTYRAFDELVGLSAAPFRVSLQGLTYSFLTPDEAGNRSMGRAAASAMLTMIGIILLLIIPLRNTWKEQTQA
jgi:multiple sugar transport system permease protein